MESIYFIPSTKTANTQLSKSLLHSLILNIDLYMSEHLLITLNYLARAFFGAAFTT